MKTTACRKSINDKIHGKLNYFIKTALSCVPFSWQNYKLHCTLSKCIFFCNVRLNTEPSQVCQAILTYSGPEIIFDEFKLAEAFFC